jgi:hypothetical protein
MNPIPGLCVALLLAPDAAAADSLPSVSKPMVASPPASLGLAPFYTKYVDADGIPVIGSDEASNLALLVARDIVVHMLALPADVRAKLVENRARVAVMAVKEVATDIPEHRDLYEAFPETDWNVRTRGIGGTLARPATSCGEENLLGYPSDRYHGETILVHEFAHTIVALALSELDPSFVARLESAFRSSRQGNLWDDTYAATSPEEYWAEGAQDWFDANFESRRPNGIHNHVNTRRELRRYDRRLYDLLAEVFPDDDWRPRKWAP